MKCGQEQRTQTARAGNTGYYAALSSGTLLFSTPPLLPMLHYLTELPAHVEYIHSFGFEPQW